MERMKKGAAEKGAVAHFNSWPPLRAQLASSSIYRSAARLPSW